MIYSYTFTEEGVLLLPTLHKQCGKGWPFVEVNLPPPPIPNGAVG